MQALLSIVIVAVAVGYLAWLWMPRKQAQRTGTGMEPFSTTCGACTSCSGCAS